MRQVVLDTETTGLEAANGHRIIEIGCVELKNRRLTGRHFHEYLNPGRAIDAGAEAVHGISLEFLADKPDFDAVKASFLAFVEGAELIIHNADFDLGHLNNELAILGKKKINNEIIDTLALARDKFPGSPVSLDALCKKYRVDNSKRVQHTALIDCDLLAKVYINLIDQKEPTLNFKNLDQDVKEGNNSNVAYFKKIISPSENEIKKHKEYLKLNLKKNYFN